MILDHEARRRRIGASEIAAILGMNPYTTPLDIWMLKTGRAEPFGGNKITERGNLLEPAILNWLSKQLGNRIVGNCPTIIHDGGLLAATPDGFVVVPKADTQIAVAHWSGESANSDAQMLWNSKDGLREWFGLEGAEAKSTRKPIYYQRGTPDFRERDISDMPTFWIQCQAQMLCTGLKKTHLAILGPTIDDFQHFEIEYNEEFALQMLADAEQWWETHIVGDVQPDPINTADALTLWPRDNGATIEAVPVLYESINEYKAVIAEIKALEKRKEELKDRITPAIGEAQIVRFAGMKIATFKTEIRFYEAKPAKEIPMRILRV